jgi:hypothetical protein
MRANLKQNACLFILKHLILEGSPKVILFMVAKKPFENQLVCIFFLSMGHT